MNYLTKSIPLAVMAFAKGSFGEKTVLDQAGVKMRAQAHKIADGAQKLYEKTKEGAHTVKENAQQVGKNLKHNMKNVQHVIEDNYESVLSWFMEPSTGVQLLRCFFLIGVVQFALGFVPHHYLSHSNRSKKVGSLYAQGLCSVTILAIAIFSFVTQTTWSLQQIASLCLLVGYSSYLLVASSALRKFREPSKEDRADVLSSKSIVASKALFWLKQTIFIFLLLSPFIISNNKFISPKTRPAPPPKHIKTTIFGDIRIPRINWSNRLYTPFDYRNLGLTNYIGIAMALCGLAFLFYENLAKHEHKQTKQGMKRKQAASTPRPSLRQQEQDDGVRQRRGAEQQNASAPPQQQQQQQQGSFYKGIFNLRAPAYLGELIFFLGLFINCSTALKGIEWLSVISPTLMLLLTTYSTIVAKQNKLRSKLKNNQFYQQFVKTSKLFVPYVF